MPAGTGYPIEDFLEAITAQLDQTQDALRFKAVNRPMTFALKDFNVDLKVFVEMDANGRVTFRPAAPNEEGASTVSIGFTTITRPMIDENTISMEMATAPSLDELGLRNDEQRQLAKIGIRNGAQLRNLQRNAGEDTLSRHTGVDLGRIRGALDLARPRLEDITPEGPGVRPGERPGVPPAPTSAQPSMPRPVTRPKIRPDPEPRQTAPIQQPRPPTSDGRLLADRIRQGMHDSMPIAPPPRKLNIAPDARNIRLEGQNLIEQGRTPAARLDGRPLGLLDASPRSVAFALPPGQGGGRLEVELPDGAIEHFDLIEHPEGPR